MMHQFDYTRVATIDEACSVLADYGTDGKLLAGGTDLLVEWRHPKQKMPKAVVDISAIEDLVGIRESHGTIVIKPLTTHTQLLHSDILHQFAPLLSSAVSTIGSPQIRNRGTIGGNIMNAAACADTIPPLIALDATVRLQSKHGGIRDLKLVDLFLNPYRTVARPDEILTAIQFSKPSFALRSSFIKLGRRNALSISRLSVAAVLGIDREGRISDARIVPGAALPTWQRVRPAEEILIGEIPGEKVFAAAGKIVSGTMIECTGRRWSTEYKEPVLAVLVRRALQQCVQSTIPSSSRNSVPSGAPKKQRRTPDPLPAQKMCAITTTINGRRYSLNVPSHRTLLDLLREDLGLTGTKCGCEIGECGACTVLLDDESVNSCLVLAPHIDGREVTTVEGLQKDGALHPLQESFLDHDAVHCGFCTPGMLMSAKALLDQKPEPDEEEIRKGISGNLCRCTGYVQIVESIKATKGS